MPAADHVYDYETGRWSMCITRSHGHPTYSDLWNANQVNLAIITPAANRRICVNGVYWATESNLGAASLDFLVSALPVFRAYPTQFSSSGEVGLHLEGGLGEPLTFNSTTGANEFFLLVNYRIVD